jgi:hypothetical protein
MSYSDEYLHQEELDESDSYDEDFLPFIPKERNYEDDSSSVSTNRKKQRKLVDDMKKLDKGYHKFKRKINFKLVDIEVYSTNTTPGSMIRDAITGSRYPQYRVGSTNENLFFKVNLATGEAGRDGAILFFDSPEQYERHFRNSISIAQTEKEKWTNKCVATRLNLKM